MDFKLIKRQTLLILPAVLLMALFTAHSPFLPADWAYHTMGVHNDGYPPLAPFLTGLFYHSGLVGFWCVLLFIGAPWLILSLIFKDERIPLAYLYLSGIPWILAWGGFFAQALEQVWILLNFLTPFAWPFTFALGIETHRESIGFWVVSLIIYSFKNIDSLRKHFKLPYQPKRPDTLEG